MSSPFAASGSFLPPTNKLKPLLDAVSHLYVCYMNRLSNSADTVFLKAAKAITMSHAVLLKEAIPDDLLTLAELEQTQLALDQINEFESLKKERKR